MRPETEEDTAALSSTTSRNLVSAELVGLKTALLPEVKPEEERLEAKTLRENSLQETLGQGQQSISEETRLVEEHAKPRLDEEHSSLQEDKVQGPGVRGKDQGPGVRGKDQGPGVGGEDSTAEARTTKSSLRTLSADPPPLQQSGTQGINYNIHLGVFCFLYEYDAYCFCQF